MLTEPLTVEWLPVGLVVGVGVGMVATLAMDVPMGWLPEGTTAPSVAAGTLGDQPLASAPEGVATAVHYAAGVGTGVLFLAVVVVVEWLLDVGTVVAVSVTAVGLFVVMNVFFSFVVLPMYDRVPDRRIGTVRRDWALSAAAHLVVTSVLVGVVVTLS
jgi:hypothetical protein